MAALAGSAMVEEGERLLHVGAPVGNALKLIQLFVLHVCTSPGSEHTAMLKLSFTIWWKQHSDISTEQHNCAFILS